MFGLQITSPFYLVIKFIVMLLKDLYGIRIGNPSEVGIDHVIQSLKKTLVHELVKEVHFLGGILKHIAYDVLYHAFRNGHVVLKVCKGHLGLYHPELRGMPCGI